MRRIISKTAFTLIELIIASLLAVIVMFGIFSINSVLSNNNQDYGQRFLVRSETQATLNHILNNASLAVGSANPNDVGILIGAVTPLLGDPNTICIHQGPGSNILYNQNTNIWLCYSWANYQINWCAEQYVSDGSVTRGASSCSSSGTIIPWQGNNMTFLGTAFNSFSSTPPGPPTFTTNTTNGSELLFSITLQNCLDDTTPGSCSSSGTSSDMVNNPEVQVSGSINPSQVSM